MAFPLVGINAMPVTSRPVGVGRYTINLTRALSVLDDEFRYLVFANSANRALFEGASPRMQFIDCTGMSRFRPLRLLMEHALFPLLAARKGVDLLHGVATMNPLLLKCASVMTIHDMTYFLMPQLHIKSKEMYFRKLLPAAARRADRIITDSLSSKDDIIRILKVPEDKVVVIYPGVEEVFGRPVSGVEQEEVLRRLHLEGPFVLFVGMIEPRKNIPMLLGAFKRFKERTKSPYRLAIAGKAGWARKEVQETIGREGLGDAVQILGYVSMQDLAVLYSTAGCLVYPSLYEGFGFPVLEAMASSLPVITSGVSSMPEIAGEAARYVNPSDEEETACALEEILLDEGGRRKMAALGRARASKFTWEKAARKTADVYREALQERGKL